MGRHEVVGKGPSSLKSAKWHLLVLFSPPHITQSSLPELLVNVYSYRLMVKGVSCCCVCGRRLFSNPVTYYDNNILAYSY